MFEPEQEASWKLRFRAAHILTTQIAKAAPERGLATALLGDAYRLHAWDTRSGAMRLLDAIPAGATGGLLGHDGRHVYYFLDRKGDETGHFMRAAWDGGPAEDLTPDMAAYGGYHISSAANMVSFAADNVIYALDLDPSGALGPLRLLAGGVGFGPLLSGDSQVAVFMSRAGVSQGVSSLLAIDTGSGETLGELADGSTISRTCGLMSPAAGDYRVIGSSYAANSRRPFIWNPVSGEKRSLELDQLPGDVLPVDWSADGARLLLLQTHRALTRFFVYSLADGAITALGEPDHVYQSVYFAPQQELYALRETSAQPPELVALDGQSGVFKRVVLPPAPAAPGKRWRSITFPSVDGLEIQGWLATPDSEGPFPTVLELHGGPWLVETEHYSPQSQCWIEQGFAFCAINYSGSLSFGRDFQARAARGRPGQAELADIVAARSWLVAQGIARPDAVFLNGWSHGGYLTLLALGKYPDLWVGGMAGAAITDWATQYEDVSAGSQNYLRSLFGGSPAELPFKYALSSPFFYAANVQAPVLIIHGDNDTRTPPRQIRLYAERLRELGKRVEIHWYDMGHSAGASHIDQAIAFQELALNFALRVAQKPGAAN